jgi:hypothetical protein
LFQDIVDVKPSSDPPQDVDDQSQLPIVEAPKSSSVENPYTQTTPSVGVNSLTYFSLSFHTSSAYFNKLVFSSQSALAITHPDEVKAKLVEVLPLLN